MKKIVVSILMLIILAVGALFVINGSSNYDSSKYNLTITPKDHPFGVGSVVKYKLPDQFDKAHSSSNDTKKLIFAFTKETGHIVREFMHSQKESFLGNKHSAIIADVSAMPTVIRNTFALPDLRESKYPMLLIYDKNMAKVLKNGQEKSKVIVMTLDNSKVIKIEHAMNIKELNALFR